MAMSRMAKWLVGTIASLGLIGGALPAMASGGPVMVGYVPVFKGLDRVAKAPIQGYTHLNIAFANPDATGAFARDGTMTCMPGGAGQHLSVAALRAEAARLRIQGAKVLLSVAGGVIPECSGDWAALLDPERRDSIVAGLLAIVDAAALDGIDVDIEGALLTSIDRAGNYTPFVAALSGALKAKGKLLTVATASYEGGMIPVSSVRYFDLVMPMSYDAIGPSWGQAGSEHATYAQAVRDVELWLSRGVAPERLALGVPYYGYGFGSFAPHLDFGELRATHGDAVLRGDVIGSACAGCDYVTFNSVDTIRRKAALARERAGGIMVWEITQDTPDQLLERTIAEELTKDEAERAN